MIHTCSRIGQAFHKAGIPKGVINIVTGRGSEIGDYLTVGRPLHAALCVIANMTCTSMNAMLQPLIPRQDYACQHIGS